MSFDTVLIANRGEIACRVIRSVQQMGLCAVAVHSDADADTPHVKLADRALRIGPAAARDSYLDGARILAAAHESGAGAIHPGYGFLSENAGFARAVEDAGLVFIGPPAQAIEAMGDKAAAKRMMEAAGVPCVPGYHGEDQADARLLAEAGRIGFPLMVKAAAGGGGKGMRLVRGPEGLPEALARARSEALAAFGCDALILERAIAHPRHVEFQVFADAHGTCIHLGERDCSVQRRHQKVIEEAPAPGLSDSLRTEMGAAAVRAAEAVGYRGAGTVEFLLGDDGGFYFLEMNTRLQVEHPVTEMITGLDLVALQVAVARSAPLGLTQDGVRLEGHAIEARLYAEDAAAGFLPATGRIAHWQAAAGEGVRVDSGVATGGEVSPHYDPMLAKLVAWAPDRDTARQRLIGALEGTACLGVTTNAGFLSDILQAPGFAHGGVATSFLDAQFPEGYQPLAASEDSLALAAALVVRAEMQAALAASLLPGDLLLGFASDGGLAVPVELRLDDAEHALRVRALGAAAWRVTGDGWDGQVTLEELQGARAVLRIDGSRQAVWFAEDGAGGLYLQQGAQARHFAAIAPGVATNEGPADGAVLAPMPGQVIELAVKQGDAVASGQRIAVLEAMKMQHQLTAAAAGVVARVEVAQGAQVTGGQVIAVIEGEAE